MCLFPRKMVNKKYKVTMKNGGLVPQFPIIGKDEYGLNIYDDRIAEVEIPCGNCIECRQAKSREWQVRLNEEIKDWKFKYMLTLTFSPQSLSKLLKSIDKADECNAVCGYAMRHSLEYWRKDHKKSLKHWFCTELGHENTERIHMHGIIFSNNPIEFEKIERNGNGWKCKWKYWKYGIIHVGDWVNEQTINYIVKYITKIDLDHRGFYSQILASPGIGKSWIERNMNNTAYIYRPGETRGWLKLNNGYKIKLPTYYKNKLFNEEEREKIWRDFLDEDKETIAGNTYRSWVPNSQIASVQETAQKRNYELQYGDDSPAWRKKPYNITKTMLEHSKPEWQAEHNERMRKNAEELNKKLEKIQNFIEKL